ncbi:MAG: hypothetical protein RLZZ292_3658 [Bacteroidota bacterium]|jgi:hypothetical protein
MNHNIIPLVHKTRVFCIFLFFLATSFLVKASSLKNSVVSDTIVPSVAHPLLLLQFFVPNTGCTIAKKTLVFPLFNDDQTPSLDLIKKYSLVKVIDNQLLTSDLVKDSTFTLSNLRVGQYQLLFTATDQSGNIGTATQLLNILDTIPPIPVCDLDTRVALTMDGTALIDAIRFDDGTVDNCCLDETAYEISRDSGVTFHKQLLFTCMDKKLEVLLKAKDCYGNASTCFVNVTVEDKTAPLLFVAPDTTVYCGDNLTAKDWLNAHAPVLKKSTDLPNAKNPGYYDNCSATLTFKEDAPYINRCGNGTYTRVYTVTDAKGKTTTATQKYISKNVSAYRVAFPADTVLNCYGSVLDSGEPKATNIGNPNDPNSVTCAFVGFYYSDKTVPKSPNTYIIKRSWTASNVCKEPMCFGLSNIVSNAEPWKPKLDSATCGEVVPRHFTTIPSDLTFEKYHNDTALILKYAPLVADNTCYKFNTEFFTIYEQQITVTDTLAPAFKGFYNPTAKKLNETSLNLITHRPNVTDCSTDLIYTVKVTRKATNSVLDSVQFEHPIVIQKANFGEYLFEYIVTDQAGNSTTAAQTVFVGETVKPTAICKQGLSFNVYKDSGIACIDAMKLDSASFDDYTYKSYLRFFVQIVNSSNPTLLPTTTQVLINCTGKKLLRLWVVDEAGNTDYCDTEINIKNPWGSSTIVPACSSYGENYVTISGTITTEDKNTIYSLLLDLTEDGSTKSKSFPNAFYFFDGLPKGSNYTVTPKSKNNNNIGLDTKDLILLHQHILNLKPLTSPYQLLAADVNNSKTITAADLVELQKVILGIQPTFGNARFWRFIDKRYVFPNPKNPWATPLPERAQFSTLQQDTSINFIGFKMGDLNGDAATYGAPLKSNKLTLNFENQAITKDIILKIPFSNTSSDPIEGYQGTLEYDPETLELLDIEGEKSDFATSQLGIITMSCYHAPKPNEPLFRLVFKGKKAGWLQEALTISSKIMAAEMYRP